MGVAVRYGNEALGIIVQGLQSKERVIPVYKEPYPQRTQMYLRFWGTDYPYLNSDKDDKQRWLPIPEDSVVQRFIRDSNRTIEFK